MELVIIGLGAGGFSAAFTARKLDKQCCITVIDPKPYDLLHACGLPYALEGRVAPAKLAQDLDLAKMQINRIQGQAHGIDPKARLVRTNKGHTLNYDKLIIATGALPFLPPLPGIEHALPLSSLENLHVVLARVKESKSSAVIGGGAIGLECAFALQRQGLAVSVIELEKSLLPRLLDPDMAGIVEEYLRGQGISVYLGEQVNRITEQKIFTTARELAVGLVIAACGFVPNTALAVQTGLTLQGKAIKVNKSMQSSEADIYAIGDCAATYSTLTQKSVWTALASTAYRQGVIAASHALGKKAVYAGTLSTFVSKVGELEIAATGLSEQGAKDNSCEAVSARIRGRTLPEWIGEEEPLALKVLVEKSTGRLLGAQAVGFRGASERINIFSCAMRGKLTARDLLDLELGYCPRVSDSYDLVNRIAELALKKSAG